MYNYFHQYFAANKKAVLPGIGYFIATIKPAELDFINRSLKAPEHGITFHADIDAADDGFTEFLSLRYGGTEADCIVALNNFSNAVNHKLKTGEEEHLPGMGSLQKINGSIIFNADHSVQQYFPAVTAEKIVRHYSTHTIKVGEDEKTSAEMHELLNTEVKKEQWWIAATILAAIGVVAITAYYLMK